MPLRSAIPIGARARSRGSFTYSPAERELLFHTQAGVFSQDGPDEGSRLLIETVLSRVKPHMRVLDLGTGVGFIGLSIAPLLSRGEVWLVDTDIRAIRLAQENVEANAIENAHVQLSDITQDLPRKLSFDLVVSNPPTHSGKEVLAGFVEEAFDVLRPGGSLCVVVNRLLSVRSMMNEQFGNVDTTAKYKGFLVLASEKRRRPGRSEFGDEVEY